MCLMVLHRSCRVSIYRKAKLRWSRSRQDRVLPALRNRNSCLKRPHQCVEATKPTCFCLRATSRRPIVCPVAPTKMVISPSAVCQQPSSWTTMLALSRQIASKDRLMESSKEGQSHQMSSDQLSRKSPKSLKT